MSYQIKLAEAQTRLLDLIDAALKGEEVFILKDEKQVIQLVPRYASQPQPKFGSAKGLVTIADDFDVPLDDFAEYMP